MPLRRWTRAPSTWALGAGPRRCVLLNMRLGCEAARRLGVDWHVCELQLTLVDFAEAVVRFRV